MGRGLGRLRHQLIITYALLPLIIASLVVGGAFLGFYVSELVGSRDSVVLPMVFSTLGLASSIVIVKRIAERLVG